MAYVVTAAVAMVTVPLGKDTSLVRFLEEGAVVPEQVDQQQIDHLLSVGLIAADDGQPDDGQPAKPVGEMTVEELKAYAAEHNIDLTGASKKDDILAAIQAAQVE